MLRPVCPHCHQQAPIRLNGVTATCTICHRERSPFNTDAINLAGKPQKVGGIAARIAGWVGFAIGSVASVFVGGSIALAGHWLANFPTPGYVIGGVMWLCTLAFSLAAIIGGRKLGKHGNDKARLAQLATVRALAQHRRGCVTAADAAHSLGVPPLEADAILTELAKDPDEDILVDVDDHGTILYLFGGNANPLDDPRWRQVQEQARIAVDDPQAQAAAQACHAEEDALATEQAERSRFERR